MKKSLTALFALMFAFIFGTATIAYAEAPAAGAAPTEKEMKTEKKTKKEKKTNKKHAKKETKEMNKEGAAAPVAPAPAK